MNNACIAAAHLKTFYREKVSRVAIIDFDVHHGNGTEDIVESLKPKYISDSFHSRFFGNVKLKNTIYKPW